MDLVKPVLESIQEFVERGVLEGYLLQGNNKLNRRERVEGIV
jgi:hypothetical protein